MKPNRSSGFHILRDLFRIIFFLRTQRKTPLAARAYLALFIVIVCLSSSGFGRQSAWALEYSGTASLELVSMSGENAWISTFDSGRSKLVWPIDMKTLGMDLGMKGGDLFDVELSLAASPWSTSSGNMKDYDYLDESKFRGKTRHDGIDLYSTSEVDSKAFVMAVQTHLYPFRKKYFRAGINAGYRKEEFDYRSYDTSQTGYGPWQEQSVEVDGPTSIYTVNYHILSLGLTLLSTMDNAAFTLEASSLPFVAAKDEDEHLKRNRLATSSTSGSGYQTSFSGSFRLTPDWRVFARSSYVRISTKGHHDQYWYGDDPVTSFDDTGSGLSKIETEINRKSFRLGVGVSRLF